MNLIVDGEVNQQHKRAFRGEYKFTNASIAALIQEGMGWLLELQDGQGAKESSASGAHIAEILQLCWGEEDCPVRGDVHFNQITLEPLKN